MKTTPTLLVIVVALTGHVHAQSGKVPSTDGKSDAESKPAPSRFNLRSNKATAIPFGEYEPAPVTLEKDIAIAPGLDLSAGAPVRHGPQTFVTENTQDLKVIGLAADLEPRLAVPSGAMDLTREANKQFASGNYRDAEKLYDQALEKAPENVYLLGNKGLVLYRTQKYRLAEESLRKALAFNPQDDFSHCLLGIIKYQQGNLNEAVDELAKALAGNSKNPTAHHYLALAASQKGWKEASLKELQVAESLEADFGDSNFHAPTPLEPFGTYENGDFLTPLERSRLKIPTGRYEPLRPIDQPIVK